MNNYYLNKKLFKFSKINYQSLIIREIFFFLLRTLLILFLLILFFFLLNKNTTTSCEVTLPLAVLAKAIRSHKLSLNDVKDELLLHVQKFGLNYCKNQAALDRYLLFLKKFEELIQILSTHNILHLKNIENAQIKSKILLIGVECFYLLYALPPNNKNKNLLKNILGSILWDNPNRPDMDYGEYIKLKKSISGTDENFIKKVSEVNLNVESTVVCIPQELINTNIFFRDMDDFIFSSTISNPTNIIINSNIPSPSNVIINSDVPSSANVTSNIPISSDFFVNFNTPTNVNVSSNIPTNINVSSNIPTFTNINSSIYTFTNVNSNISTFTNVNISKNIIVSTRNFDKEIIEALNILF